jgi:hypothetical protein
LKLKIAGPTTEATLPFCLRSCFKVLARRALRRKRELATRQQPFVPYPSREPVRPKPRRQGTRDQTVDKLIAEYMQARGCDWVTAVCCLGLRHLLVGLNL